MKISDFDYSLPTASIAQTPVEPRDSSRLLVMQRQTGALEHDYFHNIGKYLHSGDLLVLNQTRVIPARIYAHKPTGGQVELLLLRHEDPRTWECLVGGKGLTEGKRLQVENGPGFIIIDVLEGSRRRVLFDEPVEPFLQKIGHVPLPPYIHAKLEDPERYQTVYSSQPGSAAAPTAGLHFTIRLLNELRTRGINLAFITLHVGLDTFAPVMESNPHDHHIHTEWCELPQETADVINRTRLAGGRIIAVGTTSVRTLESAAANKINIGVHQKIRPFSGQTSVYILPGFKFSLVDAMITNFHLPKSTLIMLVSAFAGREQILQAYKVAVKENYRFYSFGDAMLIL